MSNTPPPSWTASDPALLPEHPDTIAARKAAAQAEAKIQAEARQARMRVRLSYGAGIIVVLSALFAPLI